MTRVRTWMTVAALVAGCVSARNADELGDVSFVAPAAQNVADYAAASSAGRPATSATPETPRLAPPPPAAGGTSPPPPSAAGQSGAGTPSPAPAGGASGAVATAGMGGRSSGPIAGAPAPAAGSGAMSEPAAGASAPAPTGGMLTLDFTSVNQGGRYAPRNVGAVWIETSSGMFVKTLERWAGIRAVHLEHWAMKSGGWGSRFGGGGNTADMMDTVSRATLRTHEKHRVTWDMQDATGKVVPDGKYNVVIEVTEDNRTPGAYAAVEFEKGPAPQMVMAPDKAPYASLSLSFQP